MARANETIAALLDEYADLLSITGGEAFKARVYEKAARAIAGHPADISTLDSKTLQQIPGVGKSIAEKVAEYLSTGQIAAVENLRAKIPDGVRAMTVIPGLGPEEGACPLLRRWASRRSPTWTARCDDGRLDGLRGFGPKTLENLRTASS